MFQSRRYLVFLFCVFALFYTAFPVHAQFTTGEITGKVTDDKGAGLPGVTVTAVSPALIGGNKITTTDNDGGYRFPVMPPGVYQLEAELQGFPKIVRKDIRVFVGKTFTVDMMMRLEAAGTNVEVVAETPVIDVTTAATSQTVTTETIENLPKISFALDLFTLTPGVGTDSVAFGAGGSSANAYLVDGVDVSDPNISTTWVFPNYNWIQEVNVAGIGAPAEYGGFTGVVANTVTRSGSNDLHGLAETFYQNDSLTSTNTGSLSPDLQETLTPPSVDLFTDTTVQLGGPIKKDKLWFFGGFQYYYRRDQPLGSPGLVTDKEPRGIGKLTYKVNNNNTVEGFIETDHFDIGGAGFSATVPLEATQTETAPNYTFSGNWTSLMTPQDVLDVRFSGFTGYFNLDPRNGHDLPGHGSLNTGLSSVNAVDTDHENRSRAQLNASVSHHASDFIKGDHNFKFGVEFERSTIHSRRYYNGGVYYLDYVGPGYYGNYTGNYLRFFNEGYDTRATLHRLSGFAQDTWEISNNFRADVGVRWDHNRGNLDQQGTVFKTDPIAPRIGLSYDLRGDQKTVIKAHYGHYYEALLASYFTLLDDRSDLVSEFFHAGLQEWFEFSRSVHNYSIVDDIKHPYVQQFTVGVDKQLPGQVAFGAHYIYRKWKNVIEDVNITGQFAPITVINPVTGEPITVYTQLNPGDNGFLITNPDESTCFGCFTPFRRFDALELFANKQVSRKFTLNTSFVISRAKGNYDNRNNSVSTGGNNLGDSNLFDDPNFAINVVGRLTNDPTYQVKIQAIYQLPYGINTSVYYRHETADAFTPRFEVGRDEGITQGLVDIFALPRGTLRNPATNIVDIRLEKEFGVRAGNLRFTADIFNLFNTGYVTSVSTIFGRDSYLQPLTFSNPRFIRLGVRYKF